VPKHIALTLERVEWQSECLLGTPKSWRRIVRRGGFLEWHPAKSCPSVGKLAPSRAINRRRNDLCSLGTPPSAVLILTYAPPYAQLPLLSQGSRVADLQVGALVAAGSTRSRPLCAKLYVVERTVLPQIRHRGRKGGKGGHQD